MCSDRVHCKSLFTAAVATADKEKATADREAIVFENYSVQIEVSIVVVVVVRRLGLRIEETLHVQFVIILRITCLGLI